MKILESGSITGAMLRRIIAKTPNTNFISDSQLAKLNLIDDPSIVETKSKREGVGTVVDTSSWDHVLLEGSAKMEFDGNTNETLLKNKVISVTGNARRGAITVANTTDCVLDWFDIRTPANWQSPFRGLGIPAANEPITIYLLNNTRLTLRNFNARHGYRVVYGLNNVGTTIESGIIAEFFRHAILLEQEGKAPDGTGFKIKNVATYKNHTSMTEDSDHINIFNPLNPVDQTDIGVVEDVFGMGGHGGNGSFVIIDGYSQGRLPHRGGVTINRPIAVDSGNKAWAIATGRDNLISEGIAYQGYNSPNANIGNGNELEYIADFINANNETGGESSDEFANNEIRDTLGHWHSNGQLRKNWRTTTGTAQFAGQPENSARFENGNYNASMTREQVIAIAQKRLANIPSLERDDTPNDDFWTSL